MDRPSIPAYVFDAFSCEVHLVVRGRQPPRDAKAAGGARVRQALADDRNQWAREHLLAALELPDGAPGSMDLADCAAHEERVLAAIASAFEAYEVPRRRLAYQPEPPVVLGDPIPTTTPVEPHWIALELVDQDGNPVGARPYRVVTSDGQTIDGVLDDEGTARIDGLVAGSCQVSCPYIEPRAATTHVVSAGDHASGIALQYGFEDYTIVWGHGRNADLRSNRANPHQLVEGDEVYVPELPPNTVYRVTDDTHTFRMRLSPLKLRLQIFDEPDAPLAGVACALGDLPLATDGSGFVEVPIDKLADSSTFTIQGVDYALHIGHLGPPGSETIDALKARLFNMGYVIDPTVADDDPEVQFALQDFQAQYGLDVSGTFDDATTAKIKEVYGS